MSQREGASAATLREVETGSEEEYDMRVVWLRRVMFGGFVGMPEPRSYEEWLAAQGLRLA